MKKTSLTLNQLLASVKKLSQQDYCFTEDIPSVLIEDFNYFTVGKTLAIVDNKEITYNMKDYYNKITNKGIDYSIQFSIN